MSKFICLSIERKGWEMGMEGEIYKNIKKSRYKIQIWKKKRRTRSLLEVKSRLSTWSRPRGRLSGKQTTNIHRTDRNTPNTRHLARSLWATIYNIPSSFFFLNYIIIHCNIVFTMSMFLSSPQQNLPTY